MQQAYATQLTDFAVEIKNFPEMPGVTKEQIRVKLAVWIGEKVNGLPTVYDNMMKEQGAGGPDEIVSIHFGQRQFTEYTIF